MDKPKITQAMIDAYDEYTHLSLDRRKFMEKLTVLAGSGAAAAAIAPLLSANSARAAVIAADDDRIVAEEVTYPAASGEAAGRLEEMRERAADYLEREFDRFTATALSLLEPVIIVLMGGVVATIVLSILLPILQLETLAGQ